MSAEAWKIKFIERNKTLSVALTDLFELGCEGLVAPVDHDGHLVAVVAGADLLVRETLDVLRTGELAWPRVLLSEGDPYPHHLPGVRTDRTNIPPSLPTTITDINILSMVAVNTRYDLLQIRSLSEVIGRPGVRLAPLVFLSGLAVPSDAVFV